MIASTVLLGAAVWASAVWFWPAVIPLAMVWCWSIAFFRDPRREAVLGAGELCAPADGRVTDITPVEFPAIGGPALRVGVFLSLFDVHINRSPCRGRVRSTVYRAGRFLAAMKPAAAERNESNTLVIDTDPPMPGPVGVRQVAGMAARRIVCHAHEGTALTSGERFGMIKFGSRTELIVPLVDGTEVLVKVGDKVRAGVTPLVRQPIQLQGECPDDRHSQNAQRVDTATAPTPS